MRVAGGNHHRTHVQASGPRDACRDCQRVASGYASAPQIAAKIGAMMAEIENAATD